MIKRFKQRKTALRNVLMYTGLFICFVIINRLVGEHRGYNAVGGEGFIFLMPFLIVKVRDCIIDMFR